VSLISLWVAGMCVCATASFLCARWLFFERYMCCSGAILVSLAQWVSVGLWSVAVRLMHDLLVLDMDRMDRKRSSTSPSKKRTVITPVEAAVFTGPFFSIGAEGVGLPFSAFAGNALSHGFWDDPCVVCLSLRHNIHTYTYGIYRYSGYVLSMPW
jgi:hypothetical protein